MLVFRNILRTGLTDDICRNLYLFVFYFLKRYHISSNKHPWHLFNFEDLRCGA